MFSRMVVQGVLYAPLYTDVGHGKENAPKESAKLSLSEKLWLDVETNLPLKRVFTGKLNKEFTYRENYSEFSLNPKVDAKLFDLPN